jgi:hypothetical protein
MLTKNALLEVILLTPDVQSDLGCPPQWGVRRNGVSAAMGCPRYESIILREIEKCFNNIRYGLVARISRSHTVRKNN